MKMSIHNKHIFKHDKKGDLIYYAELNVFNKIISCFKIKGRTLIRFDKHTNTKQLIKFKSKIKLQQIFIAGESFVSVYDSKTNECVQYETSHKEKQIILVKNEVYSSNFGLFVIERWKKLQEKSKNTSCK